MADDLGSVTLPDRVVSGRGSEERGGGQGLRVDPRERWEESQGQSWSQGWLPEVGDLRPVTL